MLTACQHDIVRYTDFNVTLDSENSFRAGVPVTFILEGEVDNIVFYSGEPGAVYNDGSPIVIKNMQNYMNSYDYIWTEPGTYQVTFVGTNCNYMGNSSQTHSLTVTIIQNM